MRSHHASEIQQLFSTRSLQVGLDVTDGDGLYTSVVIYTHGSQAQLVCNCSINLKENDGIKQIERSKKAFKQLAVSFMANSKAACRMKKKHVSFL
jgi:hypothetical protein